MEFKDLRIGMNDKISKTITEADINFYSAASLDTNSIHIDKEFAKKTIFKERIVQGMLVGGLISAVLGTKLPGKGSIYLNQELSFLKPVYIGDTITAEVEIIELIEEKNIVILKTICKNQNGVLVIKGLAKILKK